MLVKADGEELERVNGFDGVDEFVGSVKEYLAGNNLLATFVANVETNPDDAEANFKLGKKYSSRWDDEKAYPYYAKTVELDPDDIKGYKTEATLRMAVYKISSRENPDPEPLIQFIAKNTSEEFMYESYASLARYYQMKKENDKVLATWEEVLSKLPDKPNVMNEYAITIFNLQEGSKYDRAKSLAEKALSSGDEDALFMGYYNLITYHRLKEDNDGALAMYEEAIQKLPKELFFKYGYATVVAREKIADKYDRAIVLAKEAVEMNADAATYWDALAGVYFAKGDHEEAIRAIEKALELRPESIVYQQKLDKYRRQEEK